VALAALAVAVVAGCSSGPAAAPRGSTSPSPAVTPAGVPGCSTVTSSAPDLTGVPTATEVVSGNPFGVVVPPGGGWAFVAMSGKVGVFRTGGAGLPSLTRLVSTPGTVLGETLTPDGHYLLAAEADGAVVISVSRAESGARGAVLGVLSSGEPMVGAIEVAVSPDGRFAFVSLEYSSSIAVFNLRKALAGGFGKAGFVGMVSVGTAPVGLDMSPDGQWLYATSEAAGQQAGSPAATSPASTTSPRSSGAQGTLTVISIARAETDPAASVVAAAYAGCSPVRVITSADGSVVWVTARESDRLLGFSAARLRSDPAHSLVASVVVGEEPVGLVLANDGERMVVADSNRFGEGATSSLAVVNVTAALAGRPAVLGYLPTGLFPREMALEPGGRTLLVTDYISDQLESVSVAALP
jgi:DNA-binding beta-propeller fold protein YncE